MKFIPFLAFYLNYKQFVAATKITRRNTMQKYTRSILGNPSQQGKKTQPILCYIIQDKCLHHHKYLSHKRVLTNSRRLAPKRGVHFSQEQVFVAISKLTLVICFLNGDFTFTYIIMNLSIVVYIGTTGPTSITHNIINYLYINYLLH
jgi:hypothetical protein